MVTKDKTWRTCRYNWKEPQALSKPTADSLGSPSTCLSPFWRLQQNTMHWGAYEQQKPISPDSENLILILLKSEIGGSIHGWGTSSRLQTSGIWMFFPCADWVREVPRASFIRTLIPSVQAPASWFYHPIKAPTQNTITTSFSLLTHVFDGGGYKHWDHSTFPPRERMWLLEVMWQKETGTSARHSCQRRCREGSGASIRLHAAVFLPAKRITWVRRNSFWVFFQWYQTRTFLHMRTVEKIRDGLFHH